LFVCLGERKKKNNPSTETKAFSKLEEKGKRKLHLKSLAKFCPRANYCAEVLDRMETHRQTSEHITAVARQVYSGLN